MKSNTNKLVCKFYHWGPFLFRTKITPDECQMFLKEGKKCRKKSNDHRHKLAGHLSEEYKLTDVKEINLCLKKYMLAYGDSYNQWRGGKYKITNLRLDVLWINYMKSNEFNPPHHHNGDLSFVIYPKMPEEIIKENKKYKGTAVGPGGISWFHGHADKQYINMVREIPQTGDIYIFPASLHHWVFPFKSKVERVSVSGNISVDEV